MLRRATLGAIAGATGNLTLELVTYGDMLLRARASSGVPAKMAGIVAAAAGIESLATTTTGEEAGNRRSAAGALLGYALGVGLGAAYGLVRSSAGGPALLPLAGLGVGLAAMTAADGAYALSGASDPREWSTADWVSDLIPHLVYGMVTVAAYEVVSRQSSVERETARRRDGKDERTVSYRQLTPDARRLPMR